MRFLIPIAFLALCTVFFSSSITKNQAAENALLVVGDDIPSLPDNPFDYENDGFPDHLLFTNWGENDSTILDFFMMKSYPLTKISHVELVISKKNHLQMTRDSAKV